MYLLLAKSIWATNQQKGPRCWKEVESTCHIKRPPKKRTPNDPCNKPGKPGLPDMFFATNTRHEARKIGSRDKYPLKGSGTASQDGSQKTPLYTSLLEPPPKHMCEPLGIRWSPKGLNSRTSWLNPNQKVLTTHPSHPCSTRTGKQTQRGI